MRKVFVVLAVVAFVFGSCKTAEEEKPVISVDDTDASAGVPSASASASASAGVEGAGGAGGSKQ